MKIWTKIEWAIIGATVVLLLLLLIFFGYNHPHSDDFSYNYFLRHKGFSQAFVYLFQSSTGRFCASSLILLNPLIDNDIHDYQWVTAILFLGFLVSLFFFLKISLSNYVGIKGIVFLFAFLTLSFCSFMPNLHEFAYWLSAEATYLTAASLWLWAIVLHQKLATPSHEKKWWLWLLCVFLTITLLGFSEAGLILYTVPLCLHLLYRKQEGRLKHKGIWLVLFIYLLTAAFVSLAPGNVNRHQLTPFSGNLLLALSGGTYAAGFWLSRWALVFMPLCCFYLLVFGHHLNRWAEHIRYFRLFKAKTVFIGSLVFFLFCQIFAVWLSGSTPEARFENVLFLFLSCSFLFAAQLMRQEQAAFFDMLKGKLHRGFKTLSFIYLICTFIVVPNHFMNAFFDCMSGSAGQYDQQNSARYTLIENSGDQVLAVPPISAKPKILYFPTLSCEAHIDEADLPRIAFADYFGKKWIYEYPCNTERPEYSLKSLLRQKRAQYFSTEKQQK